MPITFACPQCRQSLTRPDTDAGTKTFCPSCHQKLRVPTPPRPTDRTMLGELKSTENRTLLGEMQPAAAAPPIASPIRCVCPQCRGIINADVRRAGTRATCPGCGCPVQIPLPKAELVEEVQPVPAGPTAQSVGPASEGGEPVQPNDHFALIDDGPRVVKAPRRHQRGRLPTWGWLVIIVAGIAVVGSGVGGMYFFGAREKPEDLIIGTWEGTVGQRTGRVFFHANGIYEDPSASQDVRQLRYRFINDNTIELTVTASDAASKPFRMGIRFLSRDELVLLLPEQPQGVVLRRVKARQAGR
jgi:hypothetical protein